jgi:dolichol-phosphate mannosyltransferase
MKISVLIPTKNEPLINELVKKIHRVLKNFDHEIIVIDKSDTPSKVENAKLVIQKSNGLGKAILEGLPYATGDVIVTMDGDFSHDPKDLPKLIEKVKEYDVVVGSRFVSGGKTKDRIHRKIISLLFRKLASVILSLSVRDPMTGFVAIKRCVYESLELNPIGYKINMEIMFKSRKKNFTLYEVPITFHRRKVGKSKVGSPLSGLREGLRVLKYMCELKLGLR